MSHSGLRDSEPHAHDEPLCARADFGDLCARVHRETHPVDLLEYFFARPMTSLVAEPIADFLTPGASGYKSLPHFLHCRSHGEEPFVRFHR